MKRALAVVVHSTSEVIAFQLWQVDAQDLYGMVCMGDRVGTRLSVAFACGGIMAFVAEWHCCIWLEAWSL